MKDLFQRLRTLFEENHYLIEDYKEINYGIQFRISDAEHTGILRIYGNKKGETKFDYSQLGETEWAVRIIERVDSLSDVKIESELQQPVIGCDESGKGDYFGPLVCAAVFVDGKTSYRLKALGVRDSKATSDKTTIELSRAIAELCRGQYAIFELLPLEYNRYYDRFLHQGKRLNSLLAWAHVQSILECYNMVKCTNVLVDQFGDETLIKSALGNSHSHLSIKHRPKAENNIAVAASSILARARYLSTLAGLERQYNVKLAKGASSEVIGNARVFIDRYGREKLQNVAKLHFKTTRDVIGIEN